MKANGDKNAEIAQRLREFRLKIGLNQDEAAAKFGIAYSTYKRYEGAKIWPDSEVVAQMMGLGLNANWLLTGEGAMLLSDQPQTAPAMAGHSEVRDHAPPLYGVASIDPARLRMALIIADDAAAVQPMTPEQRADMALSVYQRLSKGDSQ